MTTPNNTHIWVTIQKLVKLLKIKLIVWVVCLNVYLVIGLKEKRYNRKKADPRSFCIQKTLQNISHGISSLENQLMFAGHSVYRFAWTLFIKVDLFQGKST